MPSAVCDLLYVLCISIISNDTFPVRTRTLSLQAAARLATTAGRPGWLPRLAAWLEGWVAGLPRTECGLGTWSNPPTHPRCGVSSGDGGRAAYLDTSGVPLLLDVVHAICLPLLRQHPEQHWWRVWDRDVQSENDSC